MRALGFVRDLLALSLLACSPANVGGSDAGAGGEAGASADKACADSAYARCSRLQACSPTLLQLRYGDQPTCQANLKASCLATLAAPSTGQSATNLETCVAQIANYACGDYIFNKNPPPECQVSGSLPNGAACAYTGQCQSAFCGIVPGAACGACASPPAVGDSCVQLTSCGLNLSCNSTSATCMPVAAHLAACAPSQECALGDECVGSNAATGTPGTCETAVESSGAACSSTARCDFYAGLTCGTSKSCVPVQFATGGQPCGLVAGAGQEVECASVQLCVTPDGGAQGACTTAPGLGGACDLVAGPPCADGMRCIAASGGSSGSCTVVDANSCH